MELIGTRLGDHINYRSTRAAKLSRKSVLIDLELLHRLFRELVGRPDTAAPKRLAKKCVVVVHTVNLKAIESSTLAAY